jgi:thiol-disulfide isomerase/thioredoxin
MLRAMRLAPWLIPAALLVFGCAPRGGTPTASAPTGPEVLPATAMEIRALAAAPGARATIVNVWATWCAPCREEFPALLKVAAENRERGLRLVLVSADFEDSLAAVRKFLSAQGVRDTTWLMSGDQQTFINTMATEWNGSLPATFVYDARGQRVAFWEGMADEARFRSAVDQALATSP